MIQGDTARAAGAFKEMPNVVIAPAVPTQAEPQQVWNTVRNRKDPAGKKLCPYFWTADGCSQKENCRFSHITRGANQIPLVSKPESDKLTTHYRYLKNKKVDPTRSVSAPAGNRSQTPGGKGGGKGGRSESRDTRGSKGTGKGRSQSLDTRGRAASREPSRDVKGMCFNEDKGKKQCTDPKCTYKHRRSDFVSKTGKKASPEEMAALRAAN